MIAGDSVKIADYHPSFLYIYMYILPVEPLQYQFSQLPDAQDMKDVKLRV